MQDKSNEMISIPFARCLAKMLGDGCVTNKTLRYTNTCEILLDEFKEDMQEEFGILHFTEGKVNSGTKFVNVSRKKIVEIFKKHHPNFKSYDAYIPKSVMRANIIIKHEFLRSIYDDEGCPSLRYFKKTKEWKRSISFGSKSIKLLEDIYVILNDEFKIKTNKIIKHSNRGFTWYVLNITGQTNFIRFRKMIGFKHPKRKMRLSLIIN